MKHLKFSSASHVSTGFGESCSHVSTGFGESLLRPSVINVVAGIALTLLGMISCSPRPGAAAASTDTSTDKSAVATTPATTVTQPHPASLQPNLAHLEHLYEEIVLPQGDTGGAVWIYCEAPDYRLVDDDDEGYTCVDDMARALVVYAMYHRHYGDVLSQKRVTQLARTILSMQAPNGYFYNFLWPDNSINTTFRTSVAVPDWWSWRALWALEYALSQNLLPAAEAAYAKTACARVVANVLTDFPSSGPPRDSMVGWRHIPQRPAWAGWL